MIDMILFMLIGAELGILNGWYLTLVLLKMIGKLIFWSIIVNCFESKGDKVCLKK